MVHSDVVTEQSRHTESVYPCTLLLLQKENATHGVASLVEACMVQMTLQGIMGKTGIMYMWFSPTVATICYLYLVNKVAKPKCQNFRNPKQLETMYDQNQIGLVLF